MADEDGVIVRAYRVRPRCARPMRRYDPPAGEPADLLPSACGRPAGHKGQCVSRVSLARSARRRKYQRELDDTPLAW